MPPIPPDTIVSLEKSDVTLSLPLLSVRSARQREREHPTETEIRGITAENERLKLEFEENREKREHDNEVKKLRMEESRRAREHELSVKREVKNMMKLKLEITKATHVTEKQKLERLTLQFSDNRHAREHKERMIALETEKMRSEDKLHQQRLDERRIVTEGMQQQLKDLDNRREHLERQCRQQDEEDTRCLRNLGLVAAGVGTASGAIGGALGTTAAVGLAAGAAVGAATVLAPVAGTVAIMSGAGYVYKKVMSSNRA